MKEIIVIIATVMLGCFIANLVAGDDASSIKTSLTNVWQDEISRQQTYP